MNPANSCQGRCAAGCCHAEPAACTPACDRDLTVALVGQPNTGKSTLFNRLTGANQHVGNWPGKTVEKKEGQVKAGGRTVHIFDLPGTYSLTAGSMEERISRDFLTEERPDAVVAVVDAAQLERSLYMVAELALLNVPTVIALNKMDLAAQKNITVDAEKLAFLTGMRVVPLSAIDRKKETGIEALLGSVGAPAVPCAPVLAEEMEAAFGGVLPAVSEALAPRTRPGMPPLWLAVKCLEKDPEILGRVQETMGGDTAREVARLTDSCPDGLVAGTTARYAWISHILSEVRSQADRTPESFQGRFDKLATHPVWGKGVAACVLLLGIVAAYAVAIPLMVPAFALFFSTHAIHDAIARVAPAWLAAMVCNGVLCGVSLGLMIMGFIGAVFFVMGILENSGYMARLAYIFDPFMRRLGLHGKSVMPMLMGLICNIMGVAGSRTIDSWRQRMLTLALIPIVPCKSLLIVTAFLSGIFFGSKALWVMLALFAVTGLHMMVTSRLLQRFVVPGEPTGLIMELPPYQKPDMKHVCLYSLTRMKAFYHQGFWFLAGVSFLTWAGIYFPGPTIHQSYIACLGRSLEPLGQFMGFDWRLCIAFIVAFASKEATLGTMAVIFGAATTTGADLFNIIMDKELLSVVHNGLSSFLASSGVSQASALAFVFAIFFSLPCFATLGTIYAETRSVKWTTGTLLYYFAVSITMGAVAFQVGRVLFPGG